MNYSYMKTEKLFLGLFFFPCLFCPNQSRFLEQEHIAIIKICHKCCDCHKSEPWLSRPALSRSWNFWTQPSQGNCVSHKMTF